MTSIRSVRPGRSAGGFTLLSLLITLTMLVVFGLLGSRLFMSINRATQGAQEAHTRALRLEGMLGQLRRDVWDAESIKVEGSRLTLQSRPSTSTTWTIAADAAMTREIQGSQAGAQRWPPLAAGFRFEPHAGGLTLFVRERPGSEEQRIALTSALRLAGRTVP